MFKFIKPILVIAILALTLPALAGTRIEREFDFSGGELVLDTDVGSVTVSGTSGSTARVVITSRGEDIEDRFDVEFSHTGDRIEINVEKKGRSKWFNFGRDGLKFEIEVPGDTEIDIDTAGGSIVAEDLDREARLDTSGGSIVARGIGGELIADTSGGSILAENIDGDVNADTSGGSITVERVRGKVIADTSGGFISISDVTGDASADTSGGSISIEDVGGYVYGDTSGGTIDVTFTSGNYRGGELSTSGGSIRVHIDSGANLDIDAIASGGSVCSGIEFNGTKTKTSMRGKIGSGGASLKLRTSGGKIRLEAL